MNLPVTQAVDPNIQTALDLVSRLKGTQTSALKRINHHANTAHRAGNRDLDLAFTRQAIELSRQNFALATAKRKVLLGKSLANPIARLRSLANEADQARERLEDISQALHAAGQLVEILRKLLGIFS